MRAPHRKYTARPKFLTEHLARTARAPCALGNAGITGYRDRHPSPLADLNLDDSGVYVSTRKGKRVLLCSCPSFSNPVRLCLNSKKSPGFLRGRGFKLDRVRPLQSPVSPGTSHLVRAVSFYRSKFLDWCGPLTTYRRASCLSASTICRCITTYRSHDRREGLNPGHIAGRIS